MPSSRLPNYLRAHRKRAALSQDEVAFLLGSRSGTKICRYERFLRDAPLRTALAFEAIFRKSVRELFAGLYREVEREIEARAKVLAHRAKLQKGSSHTIRKRESLNKLIAVTGQKPKSQ